MKSLKRMLTVLLKLVHIQLASDQFRQHIGLQQLEG